MTRVEHRDNSPRRALRSCVDVLLLTCFCSLLSVMLRRVVLLCVLFALHPGAAAWGQDTASLEALQARYDRLTSLHATFTQVGGSDLTNDSTRLRGRVLLAGNRYRVETSTQTIVSNDSTTWIYAPADSQVVIRAADTAAVPLTPQSFLATAAERYAVDAARSMQWQGEPHRTLSLTPTAPSPRFRNATVWVRTADQIVTRLQATDRNGTTIDLRLRDIVLNPPLEEGAFAFRAPEGVRRVDLRSSTAP